MTRSILICLAVSSFFGTAIVAGCSDDDDPHPTPSGEGESCTRTADCESKLACIEGTCVEGSSPDAGHGSGGRGNGGSPGSSGGSPSSGGSGGMTPTPPPLGEEGESCTSRADCKAGLACILQTCTSAGPPGGGDADGGPTTPTPTLGQRGESCGSVRDCAKGLTCIPRPGIGAGICDVESYGLTPTGKACIGECTAAKDCCELPTGVIISDPVNSSFVAVSSCADIVQVMLAGDPSVCDAATPPPAKDPACFYYKTYCECAANTWACTDNHCAYTAPCSKDGNVLKGCPTQTRTGNPTASSTCDTTAKKCQPVATGCAKPADCDTKPVFDDQTDTCQKDECTCVQTRCYRKCDEDLDCPARFTCDTKQTVCTPAPACTDSNFCATSLGDVRAQCQDGKCVLPCSSDHDCSPSGISGGGAFNSRVCGTDGFCATLGCSSDDECGMTGTGVRMFCVEPPTPTAGAIRSAITD
jgi:hypothetical protein